MCSFFPAVHDMRGLGVEDTAARGSTERHQPPGDHLVPVRLCAITLRQPAHRLFQAQTLILLAISHVLSCHVPCSYP